MFDAVMAFFKGAKFAKMSDALAILSPILADLEKNYANDKDAKNALIDTLVQILQSHKE